MGAYSPITSLLKIKEVGGEIGQLGAKRRDVASMASNINITASASESGRRLQMISQRRERDGNGDETDTYMQQTGGRCLATATDLL